MEGRLSVGPRANPPAGQVTTAATDMSSAAGQGASDSSYPGPAGIPVRAPAGLVAGPSGVRAAAVGPDGTLSPAPGPDEAVIGVLPPVYPEWLGDRDFNRAHGCRFPYVVGEMARGIASADMVIAGAQAGLMAFFGSAGLSIPDIDEAIQKMKEPRPYRVKFWEKKSGLMRTERIMALNFKDALQQARRDGTTVVSVLEDW